MNDINRMIVRLREENERFLSCIERLRSYILATGQTESAAAQASPSVAAAVYAAPALAADH